MRGPTAPGRPIVAMCTSRTAAGTAASALKQGCGGWCAVASDPGPWTFGCICRQIAFAHPRVSPQIHQGVRALPSLHRLIKLHSDLLGSMQILDPCAPSCDAMSCLHSCGARVCCPSKDDLESTACAYALAILVTNASSTLWHFIESTSLCRTYAVLVCLHNCCHSVCCGQRRLRTHGWLLSLWQLPLTALQCHNAKAPRCAAPLQLHPIKSLWTGMTVHAGVRRAQQLPPAAHPREASPWP